MANQQGIVDWKERGAENKNEKNTGMHLYEAAGRGQIGKNRQEWIGITLERKRQDERHSYSYDLYRHANLNKTTSISCRTIGHKKDK